MESGITEFRVRMVIPRRRVSRCVIVYYSVGRELVVLHRDMGGSVWERSSSAHLKEIFFNEVGLKPQGRWFKAQRPGMKDQRVIRQVSGLRGQALSSREMDQHVTNGFIPGGDELRWKWPWPSGRGLLVAHRYHYTTTGSGQCPPFTSRWW